jgi:hypothetical protein
MGGGTAEERLPPALTPLMPLCGLMVPVAAHTACIVGLSWNSLQARKRLNAPGRRGGEGEEPGADTAPLFGANFNDLRHHQGAASAGMGGARVVGP